MEDSPHRHDRVVPPSPPPLLLQEDGGGQRNAAEKFQASNHSLVFLLTSPHPEAIWGLPTVTSLGQKTLLSPRKSQEMQELCVRNQGQRTNIRPVGIPNTLFTLEITGVSALCQEPGAEINSHIFCISQPTLLVSGQSPLQQNDTQLKKDTGTLLESQSVINNWIICHHMIRKINFQPRPLGFAGFQLILPGSKCRYGLGKHTISFFQLSGVTELRYDIIYYSEAF